MINNISISIDDKILEPDEDIEELPIDSPTPDPNPVSWSRCGKEKEPKKLLKALVLTMKQIPVMLQTINQVQV